MDKYNNLQQCHCHTGALTCIGISQYITIGLGEHSRANSVLHMASDTIFLDIRFQSYVHKILVTVTVQQP